MTNTDFLEQVKRDAAQGAEAIPKDEQLSVLAAKAQAQADLEEEIVATERRIDQLKKDHQKLSMLEIPDLMTALGVTEFTLSNGLKVKVGPFYSAKIPEPLEDQAFDWLENNGHDGIIKGEFTVQYRRPDKQRLGQFYALAKELGFAVKDKLHVHHQTLKAFVKDQIQEGQELPRDLFGVYVGWTTKITRK